MPKMTELSLVNQKTWDNFKNSRLASIEAKQEKKGLINAESAKMIVNQYHEVSIALNAASEDFSNLTPEMIKRVKELKPSKVNHVNGFLLDCINAGWIRLSKESTLELIPGEYAQAIKLVFNL